jgi:hypothetical protein
MKLLLTSCGWEYNPKIAKDFLRLAGKKPADIKIFLVTTAREKDKDWDWVRQQIKMIPTRKRWRLSGARRKL